jgi:hypothetical protein
MSLKKRFNIKPPGINHQYSLLAKKKYIQESLKKMFKKAELNVDFKCFLLKTEEITQGTGFYHFQNDFLVEAQYQRSDLISVACFALALAEGGPGG